MLKHTLHGVIFILLLVRAAAAQRVDVVLWFDTEDYLLLADDEASKRLAEMLTAKGVRATFKMVGEKARVLEKRGRTDVIEALKKHDIGYHANYHSVHPTPAEYLAECGLLDGIGEFVRREGPGAEDVRRIFGVKTLSCYGQPGSSWGPQTIAALPQIGVLAEGVACYVDEGNHVGMKGRPFWYCDALVVYDMLPNRTRMELHHPAALGPGKQKVSEIADRLRKEGGGLISIFYHPCEWVHQDFWDGVNFSRGRNPPRGQWKAPPQRSAEESEGAYARFGEYVDHIKSIEGVRFVTARELPGIYGDRIKGEGVTAEELDQLAMIVGKDGAQGVDYQMIGRKSFSPADQLELLVAAAGAEEVKWPISVKGLLGSDMVPPEAGRAPGEVPWEAFATAVEDVRDYLSVHRRVPARVFIGPDAIPPADFLVTLARVYSAKRKGMGIEQVVLAKGMTVLPERHVAKDTANLFGGWIIHKEGFRAPKILEVARLQAWTMKPAVRKEN